MQRDFRKKLSRDAKELKQLKALRQVSLGLTTGEVFLHLPIQFVSWPQSWAGFWGHLPQLWAEKGGHLRSFRPTSSAAVSPAIHALPATVRALRCCWNAWPTWRNWTPSIRSRFTSPWKASTTTMAPRSREPSCLSLRLYRHLEPPRIQPGGSCQCYFSMVTMGCTEYPKQRRDPPHWLSETPSPAAILNMGPKTNSHRQTYLIVPLNTCMVLSLRVWTFLEEHILKPAGSCGSFMPWKVPCVQF